MANLTLYRFVEINKVYDRITKVLILILDAGLNWWFVNVVKQRLVKQHRLVKYKPLIGFTNWMMLISILTDVSLPSFCPVRFSRQLLMLACLHERIRSAS